jgi:anti-sigma regulatory factor (Ser/Thr protein kinase)
MEDLIRSQNMTTRKTGPGTGSDDKHPHTNLLTLSIKDNADIKTAINKIEEIAVGLGLLDRINDISVAVAELCTNLVKHSGGGKVSISPLTGKSELKSRAGQSGLELTVKDSGPGIYDIDRAFQDGFSSAGSRGAGLGKVNQAVDEIEVSSGVGGTNVTVEIWKKNSIDSQDLFESPLDFGFATRKHPGMDQNGDTFIYRRWNNEALVGVIDGVGHGEKAHKASLRAREYIESHYDLRLESIINGADRACRGTRGVVGGLVKLDWTVDPVKLNFCGIGNIECLMVDLEELEKESLVSRRGLWGKSIPKPMVVRMDWTDKTNKILLIHSDGLKTHWQIDDLKESADIANHMLSELARYNDDATIVVVKLSKFNRKVV